MNSTTATVATVPESPTQSQITQQKHKNTRIFRTHTRGGPGGGLFFGGGVISGLGRLGLSSKSIGVTSGLLYKPQIPQMIAEGDCGAIGGMKIGRGNRSTRRKPAPALLMKS
jgi:hypothetical protein